MSDNRLPPAQLRRAAIKVVETAKVDAFAYLLSFSGASPDEAPILKDEILAALHSAAENERLRAAVKEACDLLLRSPGHNARLLLEAALGLDQQLGQQEKK